MKKVDGKVDIKVHEKGEWKVDEKSEWTCQFTHGIEQPQLQMQCFWASKVNKQPQV